MQIMFGRKKKETMRDEFDSLPDNVSGFGDLKPIQFQHSHEAFAWGEFVLAKLGATWRLCNKYGVPFTERYHRIHLNPWGELECQVGARREKYNMDDIYETNNGLINMIRGVKMTENKSPTAEDIEKIQMYHAINCANLKCWSKKLLENKK